ncbi:MAG: efflux RND transporter periplasmic adaptor subunit [Gammaproteobacteria bacterium]
MIRKKPSQKILVAAILIGGVFIAGVSFAFRPKVEKLPITHIIPSVQILTANAKTVRIPVVSRGTVIPRTSVTLSTQVIGEIIKVSNNFVNGGFFNKGDILVETNPLEYQLAIHTAEAKVASALQQLARSNANASHAINNLKAMGAKKLKQASAYARHEPQLAEANANLKAAQASLKIAKLNLNHTRIKAPFDGRITKKHVDLGDYLSTGGSVADIYAVDFAEVRLPLSDRQLALLDQSWLYQNKGTPTEGTVVNLDVEFLGQHFNWQANIVRSEGMVDQRDRLVYLVAQVKNPYQQNPEQPERPPLAFGLYVDAIIEGKAFNEIIEIPRAALRNNQQVWLAASDNTLELKQVIVLHKGLRKVYISSGLQSGDRVITSPLDIVTQGMKVKVLTQKIESNIKNNSIEIKQPIKSNKQSSHNG